MPLPCRNLAVSMPNVTTYVRNVVIMHSRRTAGDHCGTIRAASKDGTGKGKTTSPATDSERKHTMSVTVIKNLSIKRAGNGYDITYTSASSNVTPRWYSTYTEHIDASGYDKWMDEFATALFNGCARFLPSARCRANQAYQLALHKTGGDWSYAWNKYGNDTPEYKEFRARFVSAFLDAMRSGYDTKRYVITLGGMPIYMKPCRPDERAEVTRYRYAPWHNANDMSLETALLLVNNFARYTPFATDGLHGTLGYTEALPAEHARQSQQLATA